MVTWHQQAATSSPVNWSSQMTIWCKLRRLQLLTLALLEKRSQKHIKRSWPYQAREKSISYSGITQNLTILSWLPTLPTTSINIYVNYTFSWQVMLNFARQMTFTVGEVDNLAIYGKPDGTDCNAYRSVCPGRQRVRRSHCHTSH